MDIFRRKKARDEPEASDKTDSLDKADSEAIVARPKVENHERLLVGKQLHKNGKIDEAEAIYLEILANDPAHADTHHLTGIVCMDRGQLAEAEQHFREAVFLDDSQAVFYSNLGNVFGMQNRPEEAYEWFKRALKIDPQHLGTLSNASTALLSMGRIGEAKPLCQKILEIVPDDMGARQNLAAAQIAEHDYQAAIAVLREGLVIQPQNVGLLVQLASVLEFANQLDEASAVIEQADTMQPGDGRITLLSGLISRRQGNLDLAEQRLRLAIQQGLSNAEETEALNQLGLTLDANDKVDEAFVAFEESNTAMRRFVGEQRADGSVFLRDVAVIKEFFVEETVASLSESVATDADDQPIFFVGFPRSGTTLMEQVLKSHPGLITTEERSPLSAVVREIRSSDGGYPQGLSKLTASDMDRLRQLFRDVCRNTLGEFRDKKVVDKLPLNIVHLGLAKLLFPQAKIVVALRDPRDACLSCFMQKFEINTAMANFLDLRTTGMAYAAVMDLWLHYRTVLGGAWLEYRYEDLVGNFDETVREVLDFIGVGWHEDVEGYREAAQKRSIKTPSYRDVTAPVYDHALERWRRYEHKLTPILPLLDPFVEDFDYKMNSTSARS
jgi:tetratricopeptide (TPR) repeat protein